MVGEDAEILERKHRVRQLLGWRTRGKATIKPHNNWDDEDNFVLARSNVTTREVYGKQEQNIDILNKFFNRHPDDRLYIRSGAGMREMWEYNDDFVDKALSRSLSMEFDFKRKPYAVGEGALEVNGKKYNHLYFSTLAWKSVHEFNTIREDLYQYNKTTKHCLKTMDDYNELNAEIKRMHSLPPEKMAYMRGDKHRLRQELRKAFRSSAVGFDYIICDTGDGNGKIVRREDAKDSRASNSRCISSSIC